jgi:hypothetical protein
MTTWRHQFVSYVLLASLAAGLFVGVQLYKRDDHLNRITWGNHVGEVWMTIHNASISDYTGPDGQVIVPAPEGLFAAQEALESLQSLPFYNERVDGDDMLTLEHFLRYARQSYAAAIKEKADTGRLSARTEQRLTKIKRGTDLIMRQNARTNDLKASQYPWNHAGWRAVWHSIATDLRSIEFVALDE